MTAAQIEKFACAVRRDSPARMYFLLDKRGIEWLKKLRPSLLPAKLKQLNSTLKYFEDSY